MKKLIIFILFLFIFTSSAWATVYKWVDQEGTINFADDYSKVPRDYRDNVEEVRTPKVKPPTPSQAPLEKPLVSAQSGEAAAQPPPIAQTLIREGDFAIKLAEALKIGLAKSEAEAESMLASVGIVPKNGWIADYPVTPDVIGELRNAIGLAVDSGKLAMNKDEATKTLQNLITQQGLSVRADNESQYAGVEPPKDYGDYGEYSRPEVINNYYYNQGPPIVTYYPPPWDYYYMYAWVPYPFWCSGFWFRGFFVLHDFHRAVFVNKRAVRFTNHIIDPGTGRVVSIDPATRGTGKLSHTVADVSHRRGLASPEAKRGAASILERGHERVKPGNSTSSGARAVPRRQASLNRSSNTSTYGGKVGTARPPTISHWIGRNQAGIGPRNMGGSSFGRQGSFGNRSGITFPRSFTVPSGDSSRGFHGSGGFGSRTFLGGTYRGH